MAQADFNFTTRRRDLLTGAIAAVALPTASAVAATKSAEPNPDAELVALSPELEGLIVEYLDKRAADGARHNIWEAACVQAGLPRRELEQFATNREWIDYCEAREALTPPEANVRAWQHEGAADRSFRSLASGGITFVLRALGRSWGNLRVIDFNAVVKLLRCGTVKSLIDV